MPNENTHWGQIHRKGNRAIAHLSRDIEHDIERVWTMLTDSVHLPQWLAAGYIEQRPGGVVKLDFGLSGSPIDCQVHAIKPPELLAYSWSAGQDPERPIRWELRQTGSGTRLTLTLDLPGDGNVALSCAGWDAHLEMLLAALEGISIHFPKDRFRQTRTAFDRLWQQEKQKMPA